LQTSPSSLQLGPGDYAQLGWFELGGTAVTVSVWFKVDAIADLANIFSFGSGSLGSNYAYAALVAGNSGIKVGHGEYHSPLRDETWIAVPYVVVIDTWTHLTVVFEQNGDIALYIDGLLQEAPIRGTKRPLPYANRTTAYLGRSQFATDGLFYGSIQSAAIYYESLSPTTIYGLTGYGEVQCPSWPPQPFTTFDLGRSVNGSSYFKGKVYDLQIYGSDKVKGTQECNSSYIAPPPPASLPPPRPPSPMPPPPTTPSPPAVELQTTSVSGTLQIMFGAPYCNYEFYEDIESQKLTTTRALSEALGIRQADILLTKFEDAGVTAAGVPLINAGFTIRVIGSPEALGVVFNQNFPALSTSSLVNLFNQLGGFYECVSQLNLVAPLAYSEALLLATFPMASTSIILRGMTQFDTSEAKALSAAINDVLGVTTTQVTGYAAVSGGFSVGLLVQGQSAFAAVQQLNSMLPSAAGTDEYVNPTLITRVRQVGLTVTSIVTYADQTIQTAAAFNKTLQTDQATQNIFVRGLSLSTFNDFQQAVLVGVISNVTNAAGGTVGVIGYYEYLDGLLLGIAGPWLMLTKLQNATNIAIQLAGSGLPQVSFTNTSMTQILRTAQTQTQLQSNSTGVVIASTITLNFQYIVSADAATTQAAALQQARPIAPAC
jgi:hypothetical protein